MNARSITFALLAGYLCLGGVGCMNAPGKPKLVDAATVRPDQVLDFPTLYKQNCAACHGADGRQGAAISLANPVYLSTAGVDNIERVTAKGLPGTLMPPFGKKAGGMLTDAQIAALARGMRQAWGTSLGGVTVLPYASSNKGDTALGQVAFNTFCGSCHGINGVAPGDKNGRTSSIVDPTYLALVSDQRLRSTIIAGEPEQGMPDWRADMPGLHPRAMTDQEVTDVVAWMVSFRTAAPGQPYPQHP
jgi:mono/diheme cytochrome c family protein